MGKYTRKARVTGEVAVMEVSRHQSTNGVRTRARTLAAAAGAADSSLAYLELRSRRLEKPAPPASTSKPCKDACKEAPKASAEPRVSSTDSGSVGSAPTRRCSDKDEDVADTTAVDAAPDVEASFGENVIDVESKERYVRETTPCSLIRDSETIDTPGSTTRPTNSSATNQRSCAFCHNIPTAQDMEEFFANTEQLQQQDFQEKYNFDFVNECPLPGRYEWVKPDI
ncbi:cyclin-dependent kinase inhibitor [Musa troglodytarum]|uniref:Cyclin-dependent kinase inhibitor n=1 Tax=Musa troglodytarum TaxID=320322 RepID=A0A9E7F5R3_9LILI|nr:cyclin-dependent kinase inhibitor [Musa troglodytarum]